MKYTKTKPTVPGWYWYRGPCCTVLAPSGKGNVVWIEAPWSHTQELFVYFNVTDNDSMPISQVEGEFAGPIQEPNE